MVCQDIIGLIENGKDICIGIKIRFEKESRKESTQKTESNQGDHHNILDARHYSIGKISLVGNSDIRMSLSQLHRRIGEFDIMLDVYDENE